MGAARPSAGPRPLEPLFLPARSRDRRLSDSIYLHQPAPAARAVHDEFVLAPLLAVQNVRPGPRPETEQRASLSFILRRSWPASARRLLGPPSALDSICRAEIRAANQEVG